MNKKIEETKKYFFVDEAGDAVFYNKYGKLIVGETGCSKILMLGLIKTTDPKKLRKEILKLQKEIKDDEYLKSIPSYKKSIISFHAKDDCPEIREKVYKLIKNLDFSAEFIVARKLEKIFKSRHKGRENIFYDDLISKLLENKLHKTDHNAIYFAVRGNKNRQQPLEDAVQKAKNIFENKWNIKINSKVDIYPQTPSDEPCLQIIDYVNWAVQRAFSKKEMRYYRFIEDKISFLVDIYDFKKYPKNYYNRKNKFDINKISPL